MPIRPSIITITLLLLAGAGQIRGSRARQRTALEAEQRASEMKTEFVSLVTHELRTPLATMTVLARRVVSLLDRALLAVAAIALQKQLLGFAAAESAD